MVAARLTRSQSCILAPSGINAVLNAHEQAVADVWVIDTESEDVGVLIMFIVELLDWMAGCEKPAALP